MLGAGFEQNIAIKYAQELGIEVIAVDSNKNAEGLRSVKIGIVSDIKNIVDAIQKKFIEIFGFKPETEIEVIN